MDKKSIRTAIKKQQKAIMKTGFSPSWELFQNTFGWFQIQKKLTDEQKELYFEIWREEYDKVCC